VFDTLSIFLALIFHLQDPPNQYCLDKAIIAISWGDVVEVDIKPKMFMEIMFAMESKYHLIAEKYQQSLLKVKPFC
jgi:hypothetical protein